TFAPGATVARTFGVFNDTHSGDPVTFAWTLNVNGKKAASKSHKLNIAPGTRKDVMESIKMPSIKGARQEAELVLTLSVRGKEVYTDTKNISLLAPQKRELPNIAQNSLVVFDPENTVAAFLKAQKINCAVVASLDDLPQDWKILLVGSDALDARESASSRLAAFAATGRRVVVLDQKHPLRLQGMPAEMAASDGAGFTAFIEDAAHPVFAGLADKDFFAWTGFDTPVYRNTYEKPARGGRSLMQCHHNLRYSALAEIPVGDGLLLACQVNLSAKFAENPAAQQLVLNLLGYAATYKLEYIPVVAFVEDAPHLKAALDATGLQYEGRAGSPLPAALGLQQPTSESQAGAEGTPRPTTFILHATPAALKELADNLDAVKNFITSGNSLVLCGVTPEGLADYNKIVGFEHAIRPFIRERVTLPAMPNRLTSGLTAKDVTFLSGQRMFGWSEQQYTATNVFSHVVDYDDPAPFGSSTFGNYRNIVNGFTSNDGWPLIINFGINADKSPFQVPVTFPHEYEFSEFTWIGNTFYMPQKRVNLVFDNDRENMLSWETRPDNTPHVFAIDPPRKAKQVTLEIAEWLPVEGKSDSTIGIDNIAFKVRRPADFHNTVKPLVNIGGLMEYQMGEGRVILCNLQFQDTEAVPENVGKKRKILATILRNLRAPFTGGKTVIAGMDLNYTPVDFSDFTVQSREDGFGDKARDFAGFPSGAQRMAGVLFDIPEKMAMLKGNNIPGELPEKIEGIPVNQKADALFFLHAGRVTRRPNPQERLQGRRYELAKYVAHYEDGESVEIPVLAEVHVEHYAQAQPAFLPGAQTAWMKKFEDNDDLGVVYMMPWSNPRPEVPITTLDLLPGKDNAGTPALLGLTAASAD
ncbi:MAG: hypothetical protein FWF96_04760, partial [Kiritimatiellaeota bacterium]|nr:hypothetical protein [Kiritimatiellota bacterium]